MDEDEHIDSQPESGGSSRWKPQDERVGCMGCLLPIKTSDRYNRTTYWVYLFAALMLAAVMICLSCPLFIILTMGVLPLLLLGAVLFILFMTIPRRFHDINLSGFCLLWYSLFQFWVSMWIDGLFGHEWMTAITEGMVSFFFIVLGLIPGTKGENDYGPPDLSRW